MIYDVWVNFSTPTVNSPRQMVGQFGGVNAIHIDGRGGNDVLNLGVAITPPTALNGGGGNDAITAAAGADRIDGGPGCDVLSGLGGKRGL